MFIPQNIQAIAPPIIQEMDVHKRKLLEQGKPIFDLGQGLIKLPAALPFPSILEQITFDSDINAYGPGLGLPKLRQAICDELAHSYAARVNPADEIIVTAGANQAFLLTLMTLLEVGDKVLLPSPYYFNHEMSVRMTGGIPIEVPLRQANHWRLTLDDLLPYFDQAPRFLVIVSPNNPTGAVYEAAEIEKIAQAAAERNITIIADEAYNYLVYGDRPLFSTASLEALRPHIITISSFSKTLSMAGWRVGYVIGPSNFITQAAKVHDCMVICPPILSQLVAHYHFEHDLLDGIHQRQTQLNERRIALAQALSGIKNLEIFDSDGACYSFVRVKGCTDSLQLAHDLLEQAQVVTVPGVAFGKAGEGCLRLSYGATDLTQIENACQQMAHYFAQH